MIFILEMISAGFALYSSLMIAIPQSRKLIKMDMSSGVGGTLSMAPPQALSPKLVKKRTCNRRITISVIGAGLLSVVIQAALPLLERLIS
jgi:hypothetical protein